MHGADLAPILGWDLHVGKDLFIPIVLGILVVHVIVGLALLLPRILYLGPLLPVSIAAVMVIVYFDFGGTRPIAIPLSRDGRP